MILADNDPIDTRDEVTRPGPYCDGMAIVLDRLAMVGDGDRFESWPDGSGGAKFGRRILWWDSQGFLSSTRHKDEGEADKALDEAFPFTEDDD